MNVGKFDLPGGSGTARYISVDYYVKEDSDAVSTKITEAGGKLDCKADSVMHTIYCPELAVLPVLNDDQAKFYQNLIEGMRCAVELECININVEIALLFHYLNQPQN